MEPTMIRTEPGPWLAVTSPEADAPIGVFGSTRAEAAARLEAAVAYRRLLRSIGR